MTKKELIKAMKKESQKATAKVMSMTFDPDLRNRRYMEIQQALVDAIKQLT